MRVLDEGYSRNASSALSNISTFFIPITMTICWWPIRPEDITRPAIIASKLTWLIR
jgi:hypothetical protein